MSLSQSITFACILLGKKTIDMFDILPLGHSHSLQKPQMILCVPFIHSSVRRFLWLLFWEPSVKNKAQGVLKNTLPLFHPCLSSCGILSFSPTSCPCRYSFSISIVLMAKLDALLTFVYSKVSYLFCVQTCALCTSG